MKTSLRRLTNALLFVALGAALYLSIPTIKRLVAGGEDDRPALTPAADGTLAQIEVEGATGDNAGNVVLRNCQIALERRASVRVDVLQSGAIAGQTIETSGQYLQQGYGDQRQFSLLLHGRVGAASARIWQVCDGKRHVFTDLAWNGVQSAGGSSDADAGIPRRRINRVDLARVRERYNKSAGNGPGIDGDGLAPGSASAEIFQPGFWARQGGLPMLVGALSENFDFGAPRQMYLRNQPVYAMIGRWKPGRLDALLTPPPAPDASPGDPPPEPVAMPDRMPHHVMLVIGYRDLFPHLIEYRTQADPLSAPGVPDDARFVESTAPLLRMDLLNPRFDEPIADEAFVYRLPEGVDFYEVTEDRLRLVDSRSTPVRSAATSSGSRR